MFSMYRRMRKPNYSHEETVALLEQIELHRHILFGKATNHQRAELWSTIAEAVNSVPNATGRTVEELKHRWKDLSHRARNAAQTVAEARAISEHSTIVPLYFDMVMRILGEEEGAELRPQSSSDNQQSFLGSNPCNNQPKSEVDVKPDINLINRLISTHGSYNSKSHLSSGPLSPNSSSYNPSVSKYPSSSSYTYNGAQNYQFHMSPASKTRCDYNNYYPEPNHTQYPYNSQYYSPAANNDLTPSSTAVNEQTASESKLSRHVSVDQSIKPKIPPNKSFLRLKLHTSTQLLNETENMDLLSESSDDESSSSKLMMSVGEEETDHGGVSAEVPKGTKLGAAATIRPDLSARKRARSDLPGSSCLQSMEDLQKLYVLEKIHMVAQKTVCLKLLEEKLTCEINLLKQQPKPADHLHPSSSAQPAELKISKKHGSSHSRRKKNKIASKVKHLNSKESDKVRSDDCLADKEAKVLRNVDNHLEENREVNNFLLEPENHNECLQDRETPVVVESLFTPVSDNGICGFDFSNQVDKYVIVKSEAAVAPSSTDK